jgi:hypothetical protein
VIVINNYAVLSVSRQSKAGLTNCVILPLLNPDATIPYGQSPTISPEDGTLVGLFKGE